MARLGRLTKRVTKRVTKRMIIQTAALASILSLLSNEASIRYANNRKLAMSLNLGDGKCEWRSALQYTDVDFPTTTTLHKTIIAGYPSGDKRLTFSQLEGLTGLSARDEWEFKFLGMTNQPFIKANYPHHEGIWGWGDIADQVVLVVSPLKRVLVEYHDIIWGIGYAQTFEEAYERLTMLYKQEGAGVSMESPPVEDFLVWRDLRVFDEIHWYSWFIDYYMEGGLMRDMFNHEMTVPDQWKMAILPNYFTKHEVRHGRFLDGTGTITPSYDPMCATVSKGCYPVLALDPDKLVDHDYGPAEARKLAQAVNGTEGFDEWMIEEEAWECIWRELIIEKKGIVTFMDKIDFDHEAYTFSFELKNEMWNEINRLIEKYEVWDDQVATDLVNILRRHRDDLGVDTPTDPLSYEHLMGYHLAYPPFFPNQKPFASDDDFFVNQHEEYFDPDSANVESIIDTRRTWFEEEMEKKRDRTIDISYYDATGWNSLPAGGLSSLTPYATDTTTEIKYRNAGDEFAKSGRTDNVAALFQGYLYATDAAATEICITSDDGSKLYLDNVLWIDNDGLHAEKRVCAGISQGVYKVDLEYFEKTGDAILVLQWGTAGTYRDIAPRYWASSDLQRRYLEMMRLNDILEEDLRNLKETDFMGPTTRMEYNYRKKATGGSVDVGRKLTEKSTFNFSSFDEVLKQKKTEQLRIARSLFY